jgi:hypothetical protein
MMWLALVGMVTSLYLAWLTRHIGGPFRPIRNEIEEVLHQSLVATAVLFFVIACAVGI